MAVRFRRERPALMPLPVRPFDTSYIETRQVGWDAYVNVRGNRYSVPSTYCGQMVTVHVSLDGALAVLLGGALHRAGTTWRPPEAGLADSGRPPRAPVGPVYGSKPARYRPTRRWPMPTLDSLFEALKFDHLAAQCDALLEQAAKKDLGYRELLTQALTCEWQGRKQKGVGCGKVWNDTLSARGPLTTPS